MSPSDPAVSYALAIVMPVFDDWPAWQRLLGELDAALDDLPGGALVLAVDDGSRETFAPPPGFGDFRSIRRVEVLELARNLGHQRAIACGLAYVHAEIACQAVVIMDADGDDDPAVIPRLLEASAVNPEHVVFAGRTRRSEGLAYRIAYTAYRWLFAALTGQRIRFGNFCLLPYSQLARVVHSPQIWNHVAAGILSTRAPATVVPTAKGRRYAGRTQMGLSTLVGLGLSAVAVFPDTLAIRLTIVCIALLAVSLGGIAVAVAIRLFTDLAIPGWATNVVLMLTVLFMQTFLMSVLLTFIVLVYRTQRSFVPALHAREFVRRVSTVHAAT